jgi:hypothetical protein
MVHFQELSDLIILESIGRLAKRESLCYFAVANCGRFSGRNAPRPTGRLFSVLPPAPLRRGDPECVAQLVEQRTFNP